MSPSSTASALLTPTDFSPAKHFDLKNNPSEYPSSHSNLEPSSLLFEHTPLYKNNDLLHASQVASQRLINQQSINPLLSNTFPFVEQFSEHLPPFPSTQSLYDSAFSGICRRSDTTLAVPQPWRQTQFGASTDWHKAEDKLVTDINPAITAGDEMSRVSDTQFAFQSRGQTQCSSFTHEV